MGCVSGCGNAGETGFPQPHSYPRPKTHNSQLNLIIYILHLIFTDTYKYTPANDTRYLSKYAREPSNGPVVEAPKLA